MFRILYSDIRKMLTHKGFRICLLVNVFYHIFTVITLMLVDHFAIGMGLSADGVAFEYASLAGMLVTASTLLTTTCEFSDGCMRNKLISGVRRYEIVLSSVITGMLQGIIHSMAACLTSTITNAVFTTGFDAYTVPEVADYWLMITLACMAIGAFSTVLILILGGGKAAYIVGLAVAVTFKIMSLRILDKLFPTSGHISITGNKLAAYRFMDMFVPYVNLSARPHYEFWCYLVGSFGLIIISTVIGILVFNKKEIS